ncbi:uncharacterized protein LOC135838465 isoform X2 [Planococcus citri]|uniref:uncharacterized protein LOC135838465 isoform X2 n=1 Tax=Planococcus citri TaxID=170843 RepID=UPI0031FA0995
MLQPRKRKFTLKITPKGLLLCVIILLTFTQNLDYVKGEDERNGLIKEKIKRGERVIRHGDVNIVVLDDFDRRKLTPSLGLLSTTARTFIQEGTTTEYATHIYGTTVGDKYAHIVSTGSKIFYDNIRPSKDRFDPIITIPSLDSLLSEENAVIVPTKVTKIHINTEKVVTPNKEDNSYKNFDSLKANIPSISEKTPVTVNKQSSSSEEKKSNFISIKKEISIKPAKVKLQNDLPTFTIKHDAPEIDTRVEHSYSRPEIEDNNIRSAKNVVLRPVAKTPELTTTTYFGFADFTSTAGNTVIIFTPKTKKPSYEGSVTSIQGEPTISGVPLSTAVFSLPSSTPSTTESAEEVTESSKEFETTTLKESKSEQESVEIETTPEIPEVTTEPFEPTTENIISSTNVDDLVKNNKDVPFIENSNNLESSFSQDISPSSASDVYKTLTYVTTFYLSSQNGQTGTSIRSDTVVLSQSTEEVTTEGTTQAVTTEFEEDTTITEKFEEDVTTIEPTTDKVAIKSEESTTKRSKPKTEDVITTTGKPKEAVEDQTDKPETESPIRDQTDKPKETTEPPTTKSEEFRDEVISTTPDPENVEVELVFKTLYTTYTYLTTFFERSTTKVVSSEAVVTNVLSSTLDNAFLQLASDPAVASLFSNTQNFGRGGKVLPTSVQTNKPTASISRVYNEIAASSNPDIDNEITKPTPTLESHLVQSNVKTKLTTFKSFAAVGNDDKTVVANGSNVHSNLVTPSSSEISKPAVEKSSHSREKLPFKSVILKHSPVNSYKTTIKRIRPTSIESSNVQETTNQVKNDSKKEQESIVSNEIPSNSVIVSAPLTNDVSSLVSTKKSTEQTPRKVYLENDNDDDQLSLESNTEETHPNPSLISLQTSYTTFTYFTTLYKGTTSEVVSRLQTVTNVNTELIKPSSTEPVQVEEATAPVTYYTTYTYWTTFYNDGKTMIQSRQETVSNVAEPTSTSTQELKTEITPAPTTTTSPTSTKEPFTEPVTYYTTFTYFTTSYIGNSSVVNSHLETVTNVVDATKASELLDEKTFESTDRPIFQPTGLISSALQTSINDNATTVFSTNTYGTYVDGIYSQYLESTSSIVTSPLSELPLSTAEVKPTGLVSVNEGKIIDAFNLTTTLFTTKVIGTYIQQLYAQLIESTSSINVNTEKLSNLVNPSTVVLNDRIYQTGVLQLTSGSVIKDRTTTYYETKVIGSVINDQYSSVTETSSSVYVEIQPTKTAEITATATADLSAAPPSTLSSTSPSPAVIESSLNDNSNENESTEDKDSKTRRKPTSPFRPFSFPRSRPTFLPKKKTSEPLSAATITRGITPTIVATPAAKPTESRVFGSANRNRFASSRKSSAANTPSSEIRAASASSRRFSKGKSAGSTSFAPTASSSFGRSSSTKSFSSSSALPNYKRGSYRPTSASSRSVDYLSSAPGGSRFRIRPTASGRIASFSPSTTPKLEEIESSESGFTEQALSSSDEEVIQAFPPTTTESSRKQNPLLRFRKPASPAAPRTTTQRSTTARKSTARNEKKTTTTKAPPSTKPPRTYTHRPRPKPDNGLFPSRSPFKKPELQTESVEETNEQQEVKQEQTDSIEEITENLDAVNANSITERSTTTRRVPTVSIRPSPNRRGRIKRQAEYGYKYENIRGQSSRYRRPTQNAFPDYLYYDDAEYTTEDYAVRSVSNRNNFKSRNTQQIQQQQQPYQQYQQSYQQPFQYQQTYQSTTPAQVYQSPKIRASTTVSSNSRAQFTLREKTQVTTAAPQRTNRRTTAAPNHRKLSESTTKRSSRLRSYTTTTETPSYRNNRKQTTNRRTPTRSRYKDNDYNANTYSPVFDGTITVTHKIPTEVTIPVFNGKSTEYKNVVTAKASLQTLAPHQYTTIIGKNGASTLQLLNEVTETLLNGATEVTRFIIHESPTTSITFTPTLIRNRKTSFSHIVPSTVYEIKPEISTIPPQLNANAPLANLLLSQLLLGNLGIQPTINPLLGLNQATAAPVTEYKTKTTSYVTTITHSTSTIIPVTFRGKEIKTTVIDSSTQVITATEFITETVVISPTASAAPVNQFNTLLLPALLQAQLLNQPQPTSTTSSPIDENVDNLQNIQDSPSPSKVVKNEDEDVYRKKQKGKFDSQVEPAAETSVVTLYLTGRRPGEFSTVFSTVTLDDKSATLRKRNADPDVSYDISPSVLPTLTSTFDYDDDFDEIVKSGMNEISPSETNHETQSLESIVGNYGQRILHEKTQTPLKDNQSKKNHFLLKTSTESAPFRWNSNLKRSLDRKSDLIDSHDNDDGIKVGRRLLSIDDSNDENELGETESEEWSQGTNFGRKLLSIDESNDDENELHETEFDEFTRGINFGRKLFSIDDDSNDITHTDENELSKDDSEWSYGINFGRKLLAIDESDDVVKDELDSVNVTLQFSRDNESVPVEDEGRGRYNLATKVMSNGVEVIVALDKSTLPGSPQLLRVLPTSNIRPITLTPSTLTDHMIMMLPHGLQQQQDTPNPLVTKTYVTTYTYLTTFLQEGQTTMSSNEKVVSNVLTENANVVMSTSPNADAHVTLSSSPILATKVLQTTYKMESTVTNDNVPHVVTSQQTVSNTITAPGGEYVSQLQPSEPNFIESNSIPTKDAPNEDYSVKPTEKLSTGLPVKNDKNTIEVKPTSLQAVDVTKTYLVTYTYYRTLLENGTTVVKSNIATSSDVVTEKSYIRLSKTKQPSIKNTPSSIVATETDKPIMIFATKTYLTTFTFFTTLLQEKGDKAPQTVIRSHTKVKQNLVTETLNTTLLNPEYLSNLKHSLSKDSLPITATATLTDGQRLEITAVNDNVQSNTIDRISSSIEETQDYYNQVDNQPVKHEEPPPVKPITIGSKTKEGANFSTTVLRSTTVMKNGATLYPGSQVIKFTDTGGNVSIIPVSDPVSKHPAGNPHKPDSNKIQMNNLLNFGNLGINSLSALKPVINAMAGLWQNNIKSNVKDKNHETHHKLERPYLDKNPLAELSTNLKPPNRTPIYIPVGSVNDNEEAESEDLPEQYPDVNQRNNHNHIALNKPAVEKPLVSGGISISPGQVITANTDVIVGTPAVLGPRPPAVKTSNDKSDVPIGMKPPPLSLPHYSGEEVDKSPQPQFGEFLKIPPKPLSPAFLNSGFHNGFPKPPVKNHYKNTDQKIPLPSEIKYSQLPLNSPLHKDTLKEQNSFPGVKLSHPVLIEHSSLNPLLVNVRPSQVAQVVIPHGSQTALIYSDEPSTYSTKGEIINDPSPYPEDNVNPGFVGLEVLGPANTPQESASKVSSNTIHLDIPINPYASDGALTESHHFIHLGSDGKPHPPYSIVNSVLKAPQNETFDGGFFKRPNSKYNFTVQSNIEFIKKPNRPTWHQGHPNLVRPPGNEHKQQRPFIFPQTKPTYSGEQHSGEQHHHGHHDQYNQHSGEQPHHHSNQHSGEQHHHHHNQHSGEQLHHHPGQEQHSGEQHVHHHYHHHPSHPVPHRPSVHEHQNENNNLIITDSDIENDHDENPASEEDELTQETKLKPNNQHSNEVSPSATITVTAGGADTHNGIKHSGEDVSHDYEINQNWEIMKEKPQDGKTKPTQQPIKPLGGDNSTTRDNPNIKYTEWTTMNFPTFSSDVNVTSHPQLDTNSIANQEKEGVSGSKSTSSNQKQQASNNRNNQDDVVIGLSPPPPPTRQPAPSAKPTRPSLKPQEPSKIPQRQPQPGKNKPKPTNPPYPFEKPTPTPVTPRPKPINKPPPNILYETDAPHLADELLKMKPLNSTGRIEPVKKWPTTAKPTGLQPVYGNVVKVTDPDKVKDEPAPNRTNYTDVDSSQSDTKLITVDKPDQNEDRTTELISKWNENGVISSSKNEYDDHEYKHTPTFIPANRTKGSTVPNTIFGNLYTRLSPANIVIIPTHTTTQHYTAISMVIDQEPIDQSTRPTQEATAKPNIKPTAALPDGQTKEEARNKENAEIVKSTTPIPTSYITSTTTYTTTETVNGRPSNRTIVLTVTDVSTFINTTTKTETVVQPTRTITTTVPVIIPKESTVTVTPTEYPAIRTSGNVDDNESIFVVMTDKKSGGSIAPAPTEARPTSFEVQVPDEANEISPNDILYSGIYTQHNDNECRPECKIAKNEVCQKIDNTMRCACRPGFARMFMDHPCKPTYTYVMRIPLDRQGEENIRFTDTLADHTSPSHHQLTEAAREGLDRMVMQSNLRDIYHGIVVSGFEQAKQSDKASVVYMVQLSENPEQVRLLEEVHKTLKANNFSLGGTDVFAAPDMYHSIQADDFDECGDNKYHDCSENAQCFNLRGTYTCSCKEGFTDMSYNAQFPGRVCSANAIGCELCNYHGTCYYKANEDPTCECFQWYAGEFCQINLKVTLISLIAIGVLLSILLVVCVVMTCNKQKPPEILRTAPKPHVGFRRYRSVTNVPGDKRAIVSVDTSSEGSIERTPPPFIKQRVLRNEPPPNAPPSSIHGGGGGGTVHSADQRDRSLTVLIPRAKYRPASQPSSTLLTMSTFGPEQKLLNYAASRESSRTPEKKMSRCSMHSRRLSNSTNFSAEPQPRKKMSAPRRPSSGALVSAGFEVSATVSRTQELDEAYISQSHTDLNQPTYNSIRTAERTVSEARSYDETTIQPPVRSLHHVFHSQTHTCGSKNSSSQKTNIDEHHTMGERDLGSTYMPKSQLYKPDIRESDGSNFDSL